MLTLLKPDRAQLNVRVEVSLLKRLREISEKHQCSNQEIIEHLIRACKDSHLRGVKKFRNAQQ